MMKLINKVGIVAILLLGTVFTRLNVDAQFDDAEDHPHSQAIECVSALMLMEGYQDQSFHPESEITRAEYVKVITTLAGVSDIIPESAPTSFDDVDDGHWASGYIEYSHKAGIIGGLGDGRFEPDAEITYIEAIKILVDVLGYGIQAKGSGGYPIGYSIIASKLNLMRNITSDIGSVATRGGIAQMVFNSLDVDLLEQRVFGETQHFYATKGENILTKSNIYKVKGQITANSKTSLIGESNIGDDAITIDNVTYRINPGYADEYLGYHVVAYYKRDINRGENRIMYICEQEGRNNTLKLTSREIESVTRGTALQIAIGYYRGDYDYSRKQAVRVSATVDVIYNGKALGSYETANLMPSIGEILLLDTDNDQIFDIVFVTSYIVYIADNISVDAGKISDKNGKHSLDILDTDIETTLLCDGISIDIKDIQTDDVLLVAESKQQSGKKVRTIVVSKEKVSGIVSQTSDESVVLNNKSYFVSDYYDAAVTTDNFGNLVYAHEGNRKFSIGDEGLFGLDIYGEIVYGKLRTSSGKHRGYIIDGSTDNGVSSNISLKLITHDGEVATYPLAHKFIMDGVKNFTSKELLNKDYKFISNTNPSDQISNPLFTENGLERQLIIFELNSDLEIKSIDTKAYCIGEDEESLQVSSPMWSMKYNNAGGKLWCSPTGGFIVDAEAEVFVIEANDALARDEGGYSVRGKSFFANKVWYNCEIYNAGDEKIADLIVAKPSTSIHATTSLFVVQRTSQALNSEGNTTISIYGLEKGAEVSKICAETMLPSSAEANSLKAGDIVRWLPGQFTK